MPSLKNMRKLPFVLAVAMSLAVPAVPQEPSQGPALKRTVNLVNLFATVRDKNKRIVGDLKQGDFKVFEDNQEQQIAFFSKEVTLPITLLADFTDDRAQIQRAVNKARIGAVSGGVVTPGTIPSNRGGTLFYDAVYLACNDKLSTETGRKALVIITDAEDEGSRLRLDEAIEAAQRTDTVIHVLWVHDRGYGRLDVARKLSDETGGRTIEVSSEKKLNEAFDQISEELRSQYTLGYYPTNTSKDGRFRKVRVETSDKDYKILTRKGYYAPKN